MMLVHSARWVDPQRAFDALFADRSYAFWLDQRTGSAEVSRMGEAAPDTSIALASVGRGSVTTLDPRGVVSTERAESIYEFLRRQPVHPGGDVLPAWIGWIGYEAGAAALGVPVAPTPGPDAALLRAERMVTFDHAERAVTLSAVESQGARNWLRETAGILDRLADEPSPRVDPTNAEAVPEIEPRWRHDDSEYLRMIAKCHDVIRRGDAYQLCLTNTATLGEIDDPLASYRALRASSPAPHSGYLRFGDHRLLSASPEQFLRVTANGLVSTSPIKGTRPRGTTPADDASLRLELLSSDKERAENLMIVDLMRNDLTKVAELGTVIVRELLEVHSYAQVHQLVSTVEARLAEGRTAVDALEACFPAGSMTGTPKLSAMRVLHDLESGPRGIYSGCFGTFGGDGSLSLAMVIRSIVINGESASIGAGGGITALSDAREELAEVKLKASGLLRAAAEGTLGRRQETNR
jgi:anthranilate/para-aminobenzoate synthase component I